MHLPLSHWTHGRGAETRIHIAALVRGLGRLQLTFSPASIRKVLGSNSNWIPVFPVDFYLSPKPVSAFIPAYTEHSSSHTCNIPTTIEASNDSQQEELITSPPRWALVQLLYIRVSAQWQSQRRRQNLHKHFLSAITFYSLAVTTPQDGSAYQVFSSADSPAHVLTSSLVLVGN